MKIDLHLHTKKCKQGDSPSRNINSSDFVRAVRRNGIGLCAITNHNHFDLDGYEEIINEDPDLVVFPGIELDILLGDDHYHIIIICDPSKKYDFKEEFDNDSSRNYDSFYLQYGDFISKVSKFNHEDIIIIPHFLNKDKKRSLKKESKEKLMEDLENYIIILEPKGLHTMGVINAHNELSLIGSDIQDWNKYDDVELPEIKFEISSFKKFYELAKNPNHFIEKYLNDTEKHLIEVNTGGNKNIEVFRDINIIFGEKGSGKTYLLKDYIYQYFVQNGEKVYFHEGKNYVDKYNDFITRFENSVEKKESVMEQIKENYQLMISYNEKPHYNFIEKFKKYHTNVKANKNSKIIKKVDSKFNGEITSSYADIIKELHSKFSRINEVQKINDDLRTENSKENKTLNTQLNLLKKDISLDTTRRSKQLFIDKNTDKFLTALKGSLHKKTGKESKPNNIGFSNLVSKRLKAIRANKALKKGLDQIRESKVHNLGSLPNKGQVNLETSIEVLSSEEKHNKDSVFTRNKIVNNRKIMQKITELAVEDFKSINNYFPSDLMVSSEEFCEEVIKKKNVVKIEGNDEYEPSDGEKAIITISGLLEDDSYDCYLFDEIERGLGQKYITEFIVPKLKEQRDKGKIIVLSTHNSNIAINTLPSQTIYCDYRVGKTDVYFFGNLYSNKLIGTESGSEINWMNKALVHLEGSKKMFGIRRNVYGI